MSLTVTRGCVEQFAIIGNSKLHPWPGRPGCFSCCGPIHRGYLYKQKQKTKKQKNKKTKKQKNKNNEMNVKY